MLAFAEKTSGRTPRYVQDANFAEDHESSLEEFDLASDERDDSEADAESMRDEGFNVQRNGFWV